MQLEVVFKWVCILTNDLKKLDYKHSSFVSRKSFCSYPVEFAGSYVLIFWLKRLCDCVEIFQPKHIQFLLQRIHAPSDTYQRHIRLIKLHWICLNEIKHVFTCVPGTPNVETVFTFFFNPSFLRHQGLCLTISQEISRQNRAFKSGQKLQANLV